MNIRKPTEAERATLYRVFGIVGSDDFISALVKTADKIDVIDRRLASLEYTHKKLRDG